jgi:hypothetical protein
MRCTRRSRSASGNAFDLFENLFCGHLNPGVSRTNHLFWAIAMIQARQWRSQLRELGSQEKPVAAGVDRGPHHSKLGVGRLLANTFGVGR